MSANLFAQIVFIYCNNNYVHVYCQFKKILDQKEFKKPVICIFFILYPNSKLINLK